MSTPTFHHAAERVLVRLPDGRTARLVFAARHGDSAKVQLPSGAVLCARRSELVMVNE